MEIQPLPTDTVLEWLRAYAAKIQVPLVLEAHIAISQTTARLLDAKPIPHLATINF